MATIILTKLTKADGVTAACCGEPGALSFSFDREVSEDERARFKTVFRTMVDLLMALPTEEDELKITIQAQSLVLRRNMGTYVGVVAVKSHPVVKSLQRMIRSSFKKLGAPLAASKPKRVAVAPVAAVPQATSTAPTRPIDVTPPTPPSNEDDNSGPPTAF